MNPAAISIRKQDGTLDFFNPEKLVKSLERVGAPETVAEAIVKEVASAARDGMTTGEIYGQAFKLLHDAERRIAARYSVRRAVAMLGPAGFLFERFVADIFKAQGYNVLTDQILKGACANHEVDVVAYNDKEMIAVEVKFHNETGIKSDLKVALYVKARIDDLKETEHEIAGKTRTLTDSWLVTNTKFTMAAEQYALCRNLKLIGWNYPRGESLEDLIALHNLYPITCLTTLSTFDRDALIARGVILVSDIQANPAVLDNLSSPSDKEHILNEIDILFSNH